MQHKLAVFVLLFEAIRAFGACDVPHYRSVRTVEDTPSDVYIDISIRLRDFTPERLICLAGALRQKYPGRNVGVSMFSSLEAAHGYSPTTMDPSPVIVYSQSKLHGHYSYNKDTHEDYLLIMPDAFSRRVNSPSTTRIDLPVAREPACRLAINGRCVLEFEHIDYPFVEGNAQVSGRVTLSGSIGRDGTLSPLIVASAEVSPPQQRSVLVDWARHNLSTWRFEPAKRNDVLRITYDFADTRFPSNGFEDGVQFRLPDEVRIETAGNH